MHSKNSQIKTGAILSYLSIAVNIIAGLIYTPWMVNQIGQSSYGLYTLANSLITLFLVDFGLGSATARYLSKYRAEGDQEKANNFLGVIYKLYLIIDAVIFAILLFVFIFIDKIYVNLTPDEMSQFKVVYLIAASFAVFNFPFVTQNGVLTAYEKFIPLKTADLIYRFLLVGLTVGALLLGMGLYAVVAVHAVAGIIVIIYKFIVLKVAVPAKANFKFSDKSLYKDLFGFSLWVTIAALFKRLIFSIVPTVLGITTDTAAIAVFGVVVVVEGYVYTITTAINGMFMPKISRAYAKKDDANQNVSENVEPLFLGVGRFQYALNALIIVGFALLGQNFINLWMGSDYSLAYHGILLVIIPGLFYNPLQIANTTLTVNNKVNIQAYVSVVTGITNVILSFILSYYWGVVGACVSIFIAYTVRAILMNIITKKVLRFNVKKFIKDCYLRMSVPMLLTLVVGVGINYLIQDSGWLIFAVKVIIIVVTYLIFTFIFGINKGERKTIIDKLFRRKKHE